MSFYRGLVIAATIVGPGLVGCSTAPATPAPVPAAATVTTPQVTTTTPTPTTSPAPAAATTTTRPTTVVTTAQARKKTSTSSNSAGCGQRAVTAGKFNPSCKEYQGYLDPGTAGGRSPTSGELQLQYLCQTGQVPKSECT